LTFQIDHRIIIHQKNPADVINWPNFEATVLGFEIDHTQAIHHRPAFFQNNDRFFSNEAEIQQAFVSNALHPMVGAAAYVSIHQQLHYNDVVIVNNSSMIAVSGEIKFPYRLFGSMSDLVAQWTAENAPDYHRKRAISMPLRQLYGYMVDTRREFGFFDNL
jgi:hypothetical protein